MVNETWQVCVAREQCLQCAAISNVMKWEARAQGMTHEVRTCKGAGGPSTAVTSRELNVSLTGICAQHRNDKLSKETRVGFSATHRSSPGFLSDCVYLTGHRCTAHMQRTVLKDESELQVRNNTDCSQRQ